MKYRSYNSEILIGATLLVDVFNDIIIDRRTHGPRRDYSKPFKLSDIVKQKIEVPCIIGDRGIIMKSLENEPGRYKMPLIIIQQKGLKTDTQRMADLHADIFYQQDSSFAELSFDDPKYRPRELSKNRAQPMNISYDVTIITKYREDLDQIISNFAVHFRPDIYLKWWHPSNKIRPIESQLTWDHNMSFDGMVDYNPTNIFTYKGTSSFTLKSWLFFGMCADDNKIDPDLESFIEHIHIFPNDDYKNDNDNNDDLNPEDTWVIGDVISTPSGLGPVTDKKKHSFGFWTVDSDQEFTGSDIDKMKEGAYQVNNIFADDYAALSSDYYITKMDETDVTGDRLVIKEKYEKIKATDYQTFLTMDQIEKKNVSLIHNVYFKGSFPQSAMFAPSPSGDFMFNNFYKTYTDSKKAGAVFGDAYNLNGKLNADYNIKTHDFVLWTNYEDNSFKFYGKSKFNSKNGYFQEYSIESLPVQNVDPEKIIKYQIHKEFDSNLKLIEGATAISKAGMVPVEDIDKSFSTAFFIEDISERSKRIKIMTLLNAYWDKIELRENKINGYDIIVEDANFGEDLKKKELVEIPFRQLDILFQSSYDKTIYQILTNKYLLIVLKISLKGDVDVFDICPLFPFQYQNMHALIYEVSIPESRELLGLNFCIST